MIIGCSFCRFEVIFFSCLLQHQSAALYIARDLDLSEWKPKDRDFYLLGGWLTQQSLDKNYSILSRMIFSKMQWVNPQLLPWKRHSDLAILIVQTSAKYAPDTIAGNFLQDSVRHVSNLAGKLRKTPEQVWIDTKRYPLFLWEPIWGQVNPKERKIVPSLKLVCTNAPQGSVK